MTLGNGSGTDFQASPRHHRTELVAGADFLLFLFRNHIDFHAEMLIFGRLFGGCLNIRRGLEIDLMGKIMYPFVYALMGIGK